MAYFDSKFPKSPRRESQAWQEKRGAIDAHKFDPAGDELKSWFIAGYIRPRISSFASGILAEKVAQESFVSKRICYFICFFFLAKDVCLYIKVSNLTLICKVFWKNSISFIIVISSDSLKTLRKKMSSRSLFITLF